MKEIFYREENKYHLFKDGVEFIVRSHHVKTNLSIIFVGKMKRVMNSNNKFILMIIETKGTERNSDFKGCNPLHKHDLVKVVSGYDEIFQEMKGFPPKT